MHCTQRLTGQLEEVSLSYLSTVAQGIGGDIHLAFHFLLPVFTAFYHLQLSYAKEPIPFLTREVKAPVVL